MLEVPGLTTTGNQGRASPSLSPANSVGVEPYHPHGHGMRTVPALATGGGGGPVEADAAFATTSSGKPQGQRTAMWPMPRLPSAGAPQAAEPGVSSTGSPTLLAPPQPAAHGGHQNPLWPMLRTVSPVASLRTPNRLESKGSQGAAAQHFGSSHGSKNTTPLSFASMFTSSSHSTFGERLRSMRALWTPSTSQSVVDAAPSWRIRAKSNLDVSQPSLKRGMPASNLLRGFAHVFRSNESDGRFYAWSQEVDHIDTFVSHTWCTPRWQKFLVLALHFNLIPALLIALVVVAGVCALTIQGALPSLAVASLMDPCEAHTHGILCLPAGLAAFLIALVTLHELDRVCPVRIRGHSVFLDVSCVHQTDMELKKQGIQSLAAFLNHSKNMLVLYSDIYLDRLWCVYEVASWLLLHRGEKMAARPLFVPVSILSGCLCFCALEVVYLVVQSTGPQSLEPVVTLSVLVVASLPAFAFVAGMGVQWASAHERLEERILNFSLSSLKCGHEEDRVLVQGNIVDFMKWAEFADPDADASEVLGAFEALVRRDVPTLMWASFGTAGVPYLWAVVLGFPHALVAFDIVAGMLLDSEPPAAIALWAILHIAWVLLGGPLIVAVTFALTRKRGSGNGDVVKCLGVGLLATGLAVASQVAFATLTEQALRSAVWLAPLLAAYAAVVGATIWFYGAVRFRRGVDGEEEVVM